MKISNIFLYLQLKPFDCNSEQGRTAERYRLALLTMTANFISRAVAMLVMVLTVSLTVPYLGQERFGMWMTIASFVGMLSFCDLGIGNALTNKVAAAAAAADNNGNGEILTETISGGLGVLFFLAIIIGIGFFLLSCVVPLERIIKINTSLQPELKITIQLFSILFAINIFTSGIQRVFYGLQKGFENHLIAIFGSFISLLLLIWCAKVKAGVPVLLLSVMSGGFVNFYLLFLLRKRKLFKFHSVAMKNEFPKLIKNGGIFFLLQIGTMITFGADNLIISNVKGVAVTASFNIVQRLFMFVSQPLLIMNTPLWPAFADAHNRRDIFFLRATLKKSLMFTLFFSLVLEALIIFFYKPLINSWTSDVINVTSTLVLVYSIWCFLDVMGSAFAMFINGCNIIKQQLPGLIILVLIGLPLKFFLVERYGVEAMIAGFSLFFLSNTFFWFGVVYRKNIMQSLR